MQSRANPIDVHVGARAKLRRQLMGLSQTELGNALDLTFQQVQKYEKGTNRVSASKLYRMAEILEVPISFFFDGLSSGEPADAASASPDPMSRADTVALVRAFVAIEDEAVRRKVIDLVRVIGRVDPDAAAENVS